MRHEIDPQLNGIARRLTTLEFDNFEHTKLQYQALVSNQKPIRNTGSQFTRYVTKLSIGRKQRIVGICYLPAKAARLADAAQVFFWPYRTQLGRKLASRLMNFSLEQAEHDIKTNTDVRQLLEDFRDVLIARGDISARPQGEPCEVETFKLEQFRRQAQNWLDDTRELGRMIKRLEQPGLKALRSMFDEQVDELAKVVKAIHALVPDPKAPTPQEAARLLAKHEEEAARAAAREAREKLSDQQILEFQRQQAREIMAKETPAGNPDELKFSPEDIDNLFKQSQQNHE